MNVIATLARYAALVRRDRDPLRIQIVLIDPVDDYARSSIAGLAPGWTDEGVWAYSFSASPLSASGIAEFPK